MDYFADTSAFYAGKDPSDHFYRQAQKFLETLKNDISSMLVTSNFVIDETVTLFRMKLGHTAAVKFGCQLRESDIVRVVHVNEMIEERAWSIFEQFADKDFSFTDCTSFAIMEIEKINHVFTFDQHFAQYGFVKMPMQQKRR